MRPGDVDGDQMKTFHIYLLGLELAAILACFVPHEGWNGSGDEWRLIGPKGWKIAEIAKEYPTNPHLWTITVKDTTYYFETPSLEIAKRFAEKMVIQRLRKRITHEKLDQGCFIPKDSQ